MASTPAPRTPCVCSKNPKGTQGVAADPACNVAAPAEAHSLEVAPNAPRRRHPSGACCKISNKYVFAYLLLASQA